MAFPVDAVPEFDKEFDALTDDKHGWQLGRALEFLKRVAAAAPPWRGGKTIGAPLLTLRGDLVPCHRQTFGSIAIHSAVSSDRAVLLHVEIIGDAVARANAIQIAADRRSAYKWESKFDG
jgi:hypothetical protein